MMLKIVLALVVVLLASPANAALIQITATSAASGELGWFVVDDAVLATDTSLTASQFANFSFSDPGSTVEINPGNVDGDTGVTYFGFISGEWTVTGGGGDSLTDVGQNSAVWIAGTSYLQFTNFSRYYDVSWSTEPFTQSVPEPATLLLLGSVLGVTIARRQRLKSRLG